MCAYRTPSTQEKSEKGTLLPFILAGGYTQPISLKLALRHQSLAFRARLCEIRSAWGGEGSYSFVDALAGILCSFMTFTFGFLFAAAAMFVNHDIRHHSVIRINSWTEKLF